MSEAGYTRLHAFIWEWSLRLISKILLKLQWLLKLLTPSPAAGVFKVWRALGLPISVSLGVTVTPSALWSLLPLGPQFKSLPEPHTSLP